MTSVPSCVPHEWLQYLPANVTSSLLLCEDAATTTAAAAAAAATVTDFDAWLVDNDLPPVGTWSLDYFTFRSSDEYFEQFATGYTSGGVLLGLIVVALCYAPLDCFWKGRSNVYERHLSSEQQVIVIQHSIEALFLAVIFAPMTWAMLSANFQVPVSEQFASAQYGVIGCYMVWIVSVYFVELAARYRSIRWLVLVHHLCAAANALLPLFTLSVVNVRCAAVLTYFITWEAPVFVGLIMYRLFPKHKWTPHIIRLGMWIFGLSRPVQLAWIISIVAVLWDNDIEKWHGVAQIFFGVLFSALQLYTLVIHNALLKKCLKAQRNGQDTSAAGEASKTPELSCDDEECSGSDECDSDVNSP